MSAFASEIKGKGICGETFSKIAEKGFIKIFVEKFASIFLKHCFRTDFINSANNS